MNTFQYPSSEISVLHVDTAFESLYACPSRIAESFWPLPQVQYLQVYLKEIGCKTVIIEGHYVDRVFIHDDEVYYVRSLRSYPNFTRRAHFFSQQFELTCWHEMIERAGRGEHSAIQDILQAIIWGLPLFDHCQILPSEGLCYPLGPLAHPKRRIHVFRRFAAITFI